MKKDDELLKDRADEEEDLFDLSLDDLEPEDTIVETHVDEADEEIIELIDLVEKGDIDLGEEDKEPGTFLKTIQETEEDSGDELKVDETLDLFSVPLDQAIDFDQLEEFKEEDKTIDAIEITDSDLFLKNEPERPAETIQTDEVFFDDIADESALKELIADEKETFKDEMEIEGLMDAGIVEPESPLPVHVDDKTIRIYPEGTASPTPVQEETPEETEQPEALISEEEKIEERPAVEQYAAPVKEEALQMPPPETMPTVISEEKLEAVIRKVVEEVVERVARETMANAVERIARETNEMVERIAGETTANVAERVITDAINILKNSIESASD